MDDSPTKGDQARIEILEAARRLFIVNGFHGTSMRAIAREAGGRAVAGLYNHFPTKEAIFAALIEEGSPYETIIDLLETRLDEAQTAPDFILSALKIVLVIMPEYYDFIQLAQIDMREFEGRYVTHLLRELFFPRILAIIQRLQTLPGLKPFNTYVVMRMMASLGIGYMITERLGPAELLRQFSPEDFTDQFAAVLLYGIADSDTRP
jgi:AcrR family transcriptional regulator